MTALTDFDPEEIQCEGHESTAGAIGEVTYCDGSCRPAWHRLTPRERLDLLKAEQVDLEISRIYGVMDQLRDIAHALRSGSLTRPSMTRELRNCSQILSKAADKIDAA